MRRRLGTVMRRAGYFNVVCTIPLRYRYRVMRPRTRRAGDNTVGKPRRETHAASRGPNGRSRPERPLARWMCRLVLCAFRPRWRKGVTSSCVPPTIIIIHSLLAGEWTTGSCGVFCNARSVTTKRRKKTTRDRGRTRLSDRP